MSAKGFKARVDPSLACFLACVQWILKIDQCAIHATLFFTARKRSWGKVMFLHVSVILFTGSGGWYPSMLCRWYPSMPCRPPGRGVSRPTLRGLSRPTPRGRSPGPRPGGCVSQHALRQTPPWMATAAVGTHPTGMHSCFNLI